MNITRTNLYSLHSIFGNEVAVPNKLPPTSYPHLKRCLAAGLISATKTHLFLTDEGAKALAMFRGLK